MQNSVKEKGEEVPPGKQTQENQKTHKYHANILLYCSPETRVVNWDLSSFWIPPTQTTMFRPLTFFFLSFFKYTNHWTQPQIKPINSDY